MVLIFFMRIHPDHIKAIQKLIPKKDHQAFVDGAIEQALQTYLKAPKTNTKKSVKKIAHPNALKIFADGGSRGNPGRAGGGFVVFKNGEKILEGSEFFGRKTNNQAEYLALRLALRQVYNQFGDGPIECFLDSQLVVRQMQGKYKVKSVNVKPLFQEVRRIADQFKSFEISHVPRAQNQLADELANEAMDGN